jgi:hypothetical protein
MEIVGTLFIVVVIVGMVAFVYNKHRKLVDVKPDLFLGAWQKKQSIKQTEAEYKADVLVINKRGY